jgi:hypothetical protein
VSLSASHSVREILYEAACHGEPVARPTCDPCADHDTHSVLARSDRAFGYKYLPASKPNKNQSLWNHHGAIDHLNLGSIICPANVAAKGEFNKAKE